MRILSKSDTHAAHDEGNRSRLLDVVPNPLEEFSYFYTFR